MRQWIFISLCIKRWAYEEIDQRIQIKRTMKYNSEANIHFNMTLHRLLIAKRYQDRENDAGAS